jgi:uncharacterized protein YkwD
MSTGLRRVLATFVLAIVAFGAAVPSASAQTAPENYLFKLINDKRAAVGKGRLKEHSYIVYQTRKHSAEMAAANRMSHDGFYARVSAIRSRDSGIRGGICENVAHAWNYPDDNAALRAIYAGWRKSDGHNRCMLDLNGYRTRSAGVGIKKVGTHLWVTFITAQDSNP